MWVHLVMTGLTLMLQLFDFLSGDCKALFVTVWPCIWGPGRWISLPRHKMKDHLKMQALGVKMQDARCKIVREKMLNVEMFIYLLLTFTYKDMYDQT